MKITFTHVELDILMQESPAFRAKILSLAMARRDILSDYRDAIREKFPRFQGMEKVAAIKWLREDIRGNIENLREFNLMNFEVYGQGDSLDSSSTLSLSASKRFVESC